MFCRQVSIWLVHFCNVVYINKRFTRWHSSFLRWLSYRWKRIRPSLPIGYILYVLKNHLISISRHRLVRLELSVSPIWIYIPSDALLSPPSCGIFKSVYWYAKFVFILVLSLRSVRRHVMRDRFTETVLSRWDNFQLAQSFHILWLNSCSSASL